MTGYQVCGTLSEKIALDIGTAAWQALLEEVYTTPKPGLVDLYSCGAHRDMNVDTFERSAQALMPYFIRMAYQGCVLSCSREELFLQIRRTGMAAEQAMYRATSRVNTHKGLIFTLGIYCAAAGRCMSERGQVTECAIRDIQQGMTVRILEKELADLQSGTAVSHGEKNLQRYGTPGVRGEAVDGYRPVWDCALPVLREGIRRRRDYNAVKLQALFVLMSQIDDSTILARRGPETLKNVQEEAADFLRRGGAYSAGAVSELVRMDAEYIRRNISPGGSADLLATAVFLQKILERDGQDAVGGKTAARKGTAGIKGFPAEDGFAL